jgi:hypothetical protein
MSAPDFSPYAFRCTVCFRLAFATVEAIKQTRDEYGMGTEVTDQEVANGFDFCLGCVDGDPRPEGYVSQARMVAVGRVARGSATVEIQSALPSSPPEVS